MYGNIHIELGVHPRGPWGGPSTQVDAKHTHTNNEKNCTMTTSPPTVKVTTNIEIINMLTILLHDYIYIDARVPHGHS